MHAGHKITIYLQAAAVRWRFVRVNLQLPVIRVHIRHYQLLSENMVNFHWGTPSLGSAYEAFTQGTGGNRSCDADDLDANFICAGNTWNALLSMNTELQLAFIHTLQFTAQRRSLRLLLEWWTAAYASKFDASLMRNYILRHDTPPRKDDPINRGKNLGYRLVDLDEIDGYEAVLFKLWLSEFSSLESLDVPRFLGELYGMRSLAARVAACQRVAFGALVHHAGWTIPPEDAHQDMLRELETLDNGLPLGGLIEACPWLSEVQRKGRPFYLWDVANKRTVRTQDLTGEPLYTVISHTWGRWRLDDKPQLSIPGVPWTVPQNSRFAIQDLPDILARRSEQLLPAGYIWFDLFCIPQDRSELSKIEIARQAAVFGGAYQAIAWFNYIEEWNGLLHALDYMASYWLDRVPDAIDRLGGQILRPSLNRQSHFSAALWPGYEYKSDCTFSEADSQDGWFTSLWTLQELCLRPDMLLADRDWNICRYNGTSRSQPLTIDTLVAVCWSAKPYIIEEECTKSVEGLCALVLSTGLDQLLEPHPLSPLCLGSRRQCTERRAEAIMSVVGATRWYTETDDTNEDLVLGHYPIQFLRELHKNLGAIFFSTLTMRSGFGDAIWRAQHGEDGTVLFNGGTMLPFDPWLFDARMVLDVGGSFDATDHPTTSTWEIGDRGEVYMTEVAIVASTDDEFDEDTDPDLIADIRLPTQDSMQIVNSEGILREALRSLYPTFMKHAICLRERAEGGCEGIILMEIHDVIYIKLGSFSTSSSDSTSELQTWEIGRWEVI